MDMNKWVWNQLMSVIELYLDLYLYTLLLKSLTKNLAKRFDRTLHVFFH